MPWLDDPETLAGRPEIQAAARIAHTFKIDPLVVMHGWDAARELERTDFSVAFAARAAAAEVIWRDHEEAEAKAKEEARRGG